MMVAMVAAIAAAQLGNAVAQSPTDISANPTALFVGTVDDAPAEANGSASAYYDPATCLLYTSPSPRDQRGSRMPSSA